MLESGTQRGLGCSPSVGLGKWVCVGGMVEANPEGGWKEDVMGQLGLEG